MVRPGGVQAGTARVTAMLGWEAADPVAEHRGRHVRWQSRAAEARAGVCRGREWREGEEEVELPSPTGGGVAHRCLVGGTTATGGPRTLTLGLWYHVKKSAAQLYSLPNGADNHMYSIRGAPYTID